MYLIKETVNVTVYNEEPITGLRLDHSNSFYDNEPDNVVKLGFTYPNVWTNPGTYTVYLNVSNRVSANYTQANVTVFHPLNGFTLFTSDTILQTLEELVLRLTMASDTKEPMGKITFNLTWGDGAAEFNILNISADKKAFNFEVKVWNKLNVTLKISPAAGKPGDNFTLTFVNPPNVGFQYIITSNGDLLFSNNQSALYANVSPPVPTYNVSFENVGVYVISLNAFNLFYSVNTSYTVYVEIPLTGLQLSHGNRFYDKVNDTTKLTATFATGTALTEQWIFDDKVYIQQFCARDWGWRLEEDFFFDKLVCPSVELATTEATWDMSASVGATLRKQTFTPVLWLQVPNNANTLGFTYPHVWKNPGAFLVYLNVSNRISANYTQANVTVFHPLNGFTLFTSDTILQTLEELVLRLTMASDTKEPMGKITFNLTWGDGAAEFNILNISAGDSLVFRHTYVVQGNKTGSLELVSPSDNKAFPFAVMVWNKLNVTLNISPTAGKRGDSFTLTFVNPPNVGFQYIINCSGGHLFSNNQSALYANFSPPVPPYTVSFKNLGVYVINLYTFNPLYSFNTSYTIIVENPLRPDDLTLLPAQTIIPVPDGNITFTVTTINLTTAFCIWDFDHNDTTSPVYMNISESFPVEKLHTFYSARTYLVSFHCWNNISQVTEFSNVTTRNWNMTNFILSYKNVQIIDGQVPQAAVIFSLSLLDTQRPPLGLKAVFDFGDGSPIQNIDFQNWDRSHTYPSRNVYNGTLMLSHPDKGNIYLNLNMRVGTFQLVGESLGGLVMSDTFRFNVSVPRNFSGSATVYFGDGSFTSKCEKVDTVWIFSHIYQRVGYYQASLTGYGPVVSNTSSPTFTENVTFPGTLEVEGSVKDLTLEVFPRVIHHPPGNVTALVWLYSPHRIMHLNCTFNWNEIMDETFITLTGPMESNTVVTYQYNYITLGSKVVTLECSNAYSHNIAQVEVFVNNDCFSPDPIFDRQYSKQAKPMIVLNSEPAKLVTRTVIKCTDIKPNFTWAIKIVNNDSMLAYKYPDLDYLTWERGQLEPDLYRFSLNISFGREHDFCWLSEMIYVRVERAPLVVDIQGGKVRKTGDRHAIVDARTGSYDRVMGYGNNNGLAFTWSCRAYNSTSVQELLSLESAAPSGLSIPCDSISTEIEAGKRQLNISDDVQSMGFLFEVAVSYGGLASNATAYVQFIRGSLNAEIV
ncbi:hypothetical protein C0Q70_11558 [Pomacea canaliculata]|uniref:PKD/REJ-like domain-containing protein n=1 Tax=Pomacea canaliculata TaxID=400727 RepID=A0A2T7P6A5_POMCA|nr:hypothetical protein C0Q70_11558 [Pomacea canaliculata]